jgi:hypothetical protein
MKRGNRNQKPENKSIGVKWVWRRDPKDMLEKEGIDFDSLEIDDEEENGKEILWSVEYVPLVLCERKRRELKQNSLGFACSPHQKTTRNNNKKW